MRKFSLLAMLLGLGMFSVGCETKPSDVAEEKGEAAAAHAEAGHAEAEHMAGNVDADTVKDKREDAMEEDKEAADTAADAVKDGNLAAPVEPAPGT